MIELTKLFDQYNRRARLYPALLVLFPPILLAVCWFPGLVIDADVKLLFLLFSSMGGLYLLASMSRVAGKKVEKRLLEAWGGWPSTIWLRHRDGHLVKATRQRCHDYLGQNIPGINMPTAEEERADPSSADEVYLSAIGWLKERRRGPEFSLVLEENIEYGFRRNTLGLRWPAFAICCVVTFLAAIAVVLGVEGFDSGIAIEGILRILGGVSVPVGMAMLVNLLAALFWLFYVTDSWVREAGDQYARALLATCQ